jgi:hypothetical protein
MQTQGGEKLVEQLNQKRAFTRREIEAARKEGVITEDQAAEMMSREAPVEGAGFFLLPGVDWVLSSWLASGSTVIEFGGLSPAVADISGLLYPARAMWLRDEGATREECGLMHRLFRLLDREAYRIKRQQLAEALDG